MQTYELRRSLSLTMLVFYGLGTTIGAGIYVLVGKVAGEAGVYAPLSFLLAALVAAPTALSFGELAARYPRSAGEAVYTDAAFGLPQFSRAVGLAVVCVGLISSAAIVSGAVGYLQNMVAMPDWFGLLAVIGLLVVVAIWGISESVLLTAVATVIEIGGLLVIVWFGRDAFDPSRVVETVSVQPFDAVWPVGIVSGAILAFYAFIGFEDMVNVSEEVRDPSRTVPRAIAITLVVTAILYGLVSWVSVSTLPVEQLAASKAPMSDIFARLTSLPTDAFDALVVGAVINGALVQIIMASRVLYGLARNGWLPSLIGAVSVRTRTPYIATLLAGSCVLLMALMLPLETLARATSLITLLIFAVVNVALVRVRGRAIDVRGFRRLPVAVPVGGLVLSLALAGFQILGLVGVVDLS